MFYGQRVLDGVPNNLLKDDGLRNFFFVQDKGMKLSVILRNYPPPWYPGFKMTAPSWGFHSRPRFSPYSRLYIEICIYSSGELGGLLGASLGASFLTFIELFDYIFTRIAIKLEGRRSRIINVKSFDDKDATSR